MSSNFFSSVCMWNTSLLQCTVNLLIFEASEITKSIFAHIAKIFQIAILHKESAFHTHLSIKCNLIFLSPRHDVTCKKKLSLLCERDLRGEEEMEIAHIPLWCICLSSYYFNTFLYHSHSHLMKLFWSNKMQQTCIKA